MDMVKMDRAVIGLLAMILDKRMFIIDDKEFVGEKQSLQSPFLPVEQTKFIARLMNRIAYEVYEEEGKVNIYGSFLMVNIKEALSRLVCRDERLKLFGSDFWVINKELKSHCAEMSLHEIPHVVRKNLVSNVPWVYDFEIRAKLFRFLCKQVQEQHSYGLEVEQIEIRRDYLLEDAIEKINGGHVNPRM